MVAGDGNGVEFHNAIIDGHHALDVVQLGVINLGILDSELIETGHRGFKGYSVSGFCLRDFKQVVIDFAQVNALKINLIILPTIFRVSNKGQTTGAVKCRVELLVKDVNGVLEMGGLADFYEVFIGLFHTCPPGGDNGTHTVFLARVAVDDASISIAFLIELHHIQEVIPLVVDIHLFGELEGGTVLQR